MSRPTRASLKPKIRLVETAEIDRLSAELTAARSAAFSEGIRAGQLGRQLSAIRALVDEQAADYGLWGVPIGRLQPITEAYLQQELRRLHALIEGEG